MTAMLQPYLAALTVLSGLAQAPDEAPQRWSAAKANEWYLNRPWLVGCNFIPSTAINQLEMWQADTFEPATIDRELGWAAGIGFNTVRVFLHDIPWRQDSEGFLKRIDTFLGICERHGIAPLLVFFDACWDPLPKPGPQHAPTPHVHNSGWVQCPSVEILKDPARHAELEPYVTGILKRFGDDARILGWDLYNEPANRNVDSYGKTELPDKAERSVELLHAVFAWAQAVRPSQPLTVGVWQGDWPDPDELSPANRFILEQSDIVSFHSYAPLEDVRPRVEALERYGRPILCTEYMSRPTGSTFANILPYLKEKRVGAYNWGLVSGKTQTIYPWESWRKPFTAEPPVWFHDVFRPDGTPYLAEEAATIRGLTGKE